MFFFPVLGAPKTANTRVVPNVLSSGLVDWNWRRHDYKARVRLQVLRGGGKGRLILAVPGCRCKGI